MCSHRNYCRIHHQNKSSLPKKYVSLEVSAGGSTDTRASIVIIAAYITRISRLCCSKYVSLEVSAGGSTDTCAPVVIIAAYMMRKSLLCHKKYVSLEVCAGGSTCIHMCVLLL